MLMTSAMDAHHLPSPRLGERNSKALAVGRLSAPPSGDPELLQKLLRFVRHTLAELDPSSHGHVEERLDVFRRAFGHFTAAFGAYAPLLLAVQEAYEDALAHAHARATGVDEAAERLALMQEETTQLMAHLKQDASTEHDGMAAMVAERDEKLRAASRENDKLRGEVRRLTNEMVHSQKLRDDLELRNVELSKQVEHWQAETAEARRQAGGEDNELERMRREVKALTEREINFLIEDREQRTLFRETKQELEEMKSTTVPKELHKNLTDQLARAHLGLKAAKAECEELRRILAGGESHSAFPNGLEWAAEDLGEIAYLDPGWRGRQVHGIIADLVDDILTLYRHSGATYKPSSTAALTRSGRRGPLFTLDAIDGAMGSEARAVVLLQGETSYLREGGSSFDGFVRLRPFLWPLDDVRSCIRKMWTEYKRRVLTLQGRRGRDGAVSPTPSSGNLMLPETTIQIMHELMASWLTSYHQAKAEGAYDGEGGGGGGGRKPKREAVHKGLLCSDMYNLQASMWRLRDDEPQAAIFCQVCIGRLPPSTFAELHKTCNSLYRSLSTVAVKDRVPLDAVRPRLQSALPGASDAQREAIVHKLILDGGSAAAAAEGATVRLSAMEPAAKEPCDGKETTAVQCELQRCFMIVGMMLRDDLEEAILRAAGYSILASAGLEKAALAHAMGSGPLLGPVDVAELVVRPREVRSALIRVDSAMPEPTVADHLMRAFGGTPGAGARAVKAAGGVPMGVLGGGGAEGGGGGSDETAKEAGALVAEEEPTIGIEELFARLFAEPMRRFSPRTDADLKDKLAGIVKAGGAGGGKKGKGGGKKGKAGDGPALVTYTQLRDLVLKADPKRPPVEVDFLAAHCIARARGVGGGGQPSGSGGAPTAAPAAVSSGGSPPGSPVPGGAAGPLGADQDPMAAAAPLDRVLEALETALIQPTTDRTAHLTP